MALATWEINYDQRQVGEFLGTRPGIGTPFYHLSRLTEVNVTLAKWAGLDAIVVALGEGEMVITALITNSGLPGWGTVRTSHAVLITAVQEEQITYHDPAWAEAEERVAFLRPK